MTISMSADPLLDATADVDRGWAVVEMRQDGSLGQPQLVTATGPEEAALLARVVPVQRRPMEGCSALDARLGLLQADAGHLTEARRSFTRVLDGSCVGAERQDCLGRLAMLEAHHGALRSAEAHAGLALATPSTDQDPGVRHARLAMAWISLERGEEDEAAALLDAMPLVVDEAQEPWLSTARMLLEARLLVTTRRPDSAVRLLVETTDTTSETRAGWASALLSVARADALLALGEPHRALGALTPVPVEAHVDASVVIAAACLAIGDVRGADAVLGRVVEALDRAPVPVQLRAWLLEAHVAQERGRCPRARELIDRALRAASEEGMRISVGREWPWLRQVVDRDAGLARTHRDFLAGFRGDSRTPVRAAASQVLSRSDRQPGVSLTAREVEVLGLLAQMCSTDEIAAALFVSSNTVKTHLKGIFGKLCVNRRVEAVRRGRELGLC